MTGCGNDSKAANEDNFEAALNAHYAQMKECIRVGSAPNAEGIIQEFRTDGRAQDKELPFYNGLVDLGLLDAVSYQKDTNNFSGQVTGKADWVAVQPRGISLKCVPIAAQAYTASQIHHSKLYPPHQDLISQEHRVCLA